VYEDIKSGISLEIPDDDYQCFIRPYENKKRLDGIRESRTK
jgi:hypothetical protein